MKRKKTDCIPWMGAIDRNGYGTFDNKYAHRFVYEGYYGPIPEGLFVDHQCHNRDDTCAGGPTCIHRRCVNPGHLDVVTPSISARRTVTAKRTHCKSGHAFTAENTYRRPDNGCRVCKECRRLGLRRWYAKKRSKK